VAVEGVFRSASPDAIIHAAAWTDVDACERDPDRARRFNVVGTANVARAAGRAFLVVVSTDYVFDGELGRAYVETDEPSPLQVYGRTKLEAERIALSQAPRTAVARGAWLYGAYTARGDLARNFVTSVLRAARRGPIDVVDDQVGSPTTVTDFADALARLVNEPATGVLHAVNEGEVSRFELARAVVERAGLDPSLVRPVPTAEAPVRPAMRPPFAPLEGKAWRAAGFEALPSWDDALERALPQILEALP
jgi:dTDP-4-dehydrorhamnose reductase